jgi:hypothetical protein
MKTISIICYQFSSSSRDRLAWKFDISESITSIRMIWISCSW